MSTPLEITKSLFWNKANQFYIDVQPLKGSVPVSMDEFNASLISIDVPDVANENYEDYIAGKFYVAYGRNSIYQITATFKDVWPNKMYTFFNEYLVKNRKQYTDDCKWTIRVDTTYPGGSRNEVLNVDDALLVGVSNLSFDHSNDQILEFSVTWKFTLFNDEGALRTSG